VTNLPYAEKQALLELRLIKYTVYVFLMSDQTYCVHMVESWKSARGFAWSRWNNKRAATATPIGMIGKWYSSELSAECYDKVWLYCIMAFDTPYPAPPAEHNYIVNRKVYTQSNYDLKDHFLHIFTRARSQSRGASGSNRPCAVCSWYHGSLHTAKTCLQTCSRAWYLPVATH
jgi:hypothetical protein